SIADIVPLMARDYFLGKHSDGALLSPLEQSVLISFGLQCKPFEEIHEDLGLPVGQLLSMFSKTTKKLAASYTHKAG
ncbi:MAG: uncharacterized protein A8A55_3282, partial [Amphiamblys sp. WSBS2006]